MSEVQDSPTAEAWRPVQVGYNTYLTDLPEGNPFTLADYQPVLALRPSELDFLPDGEFHLTSERGSVLYTLSLDQTDGVRTFGITELSPLARQTNEANAGILRNTGFVLQPGQYGDEIITRVPTPNNFARIAGTLGVAVRLFPDHKQLPASVFMAAQREGFHPVATANELFYYHDCAGDHMASMVLGGVVLRQTITEIAELYADADESGIRMAAEVIDALTTWIHLFGRPAYKKSTAGFGNLHNVTTESAKKVGVPSNRIDEIIEVVRETAPTYQKPPQAD